MGMARKLRFIPHARTLISITCRAIQGRFLFRPGLQRNDVVLGGLGRAQRRYETTISAVFVMSTHLHLLMVVDDAKEPCAFHAVRQLEARSRGPSLDRLAGARLRSALRDDRGH